MRDISVSDNCEVSPVSRRAVRDDLEWEKESHKSLHIGKRFQIFNV